MKALHLLLASTAIAGVNEDFLKAAYYGDLSAVESFIAKGADVNAKRNDGWTALHIASSFGYKEIVELLLAKGVDVNAKDDDGSTPLLLASQKGHKEVVELLIKAGADESTVENFKRRPSEYLVVNEDRTFAEATVPIASTAPMKHLIIRVIKKLPKGIVLTGGAFIARVGGLSSARTLVKPPKGIMLVKLIFDFYAKDETTVIWKNELALTGSDNFKFTPLYLVKYEEDDDFLLYGSDGLTMKKGGNRIAAIFAAKNGDPLKIHFLLNGKDYGTLASLKKK